MSAKKAVIDIGSNSILLLVASRDEAGVLDIHCDLNRVARLSEGVHERGTLSDEAIGRALVILKEYRGVCDELGLRPRALATEGVRMASDRERFLVPAAEVLGCEVEAISGEREAQLSYLSVAREELGVDPLRVIDIGGASTELVHGRGEQILSSASHAIGSVRLTERCIRDPEGRASDADIAAIEALADEAFSTQVLEPAPELYGLAGTVTSAAAVMLQLEHYERDRVDGTRWTPVQLDELRARMAAMTTQQRVASTLLPPKRADLVVAGVSILLRAMLHCGAQTLVVRDRGLRYALIETMRIELHCHSTCSDGSLAPADLAARARAREVRLFCLTDHDTTAGHAAAAAELPDSICLEGLELSCKEAGKTVHLLMYGLDRGPGREALETRLEAINVQRRERIEQILDKLDALGFVLEREDVRARSHGRTPGRPDVAAALVRAGICNSMRQAFDRFLKDGGPADVSVDRVSLGEGLALGRACAPRMSLAHPHSLRNVALVEDIFRRYRDAGLEGIEAHYGRYGASERAHWGRIADKFGLVITTGSDFHGDASPEVHQPGVDCAGPILHKLCEWLEVQP